MLRLNLLVLLLTTALVSAQVPSIPKVETKKKPITVEMLSNPVGRGVVGGGGSVEWIDSGRWQQSKNGVFCNIDADTGTSHPAFDPAAFRKSLSSIKGLEKQRINAILRGNGLQPDPTRTGTLIDVDGGLFFAFFDGRQSLKLASGIDDKSCPALAPDGKSLAFVRAGNLFSIDMETQAETRYTRDGGGEILNGRGDWVYEEEIFNRDGRAFWWSPDSKHLAFLRFDDAPVKKFTIARAYPARGTAEVYGYPKPGDPNPLVSLHLATITDGKTIALPLGNRDPADTLIARVGWTPKNEVYAYVQNRVQTWLDVVLWPDPALPGKVLFRDSTPAWIDDPGEIRFLKDGSFLFPSERGGWKHLYHYKADGTLIGPVTQGPWAIKDVLRADEDRVYFTSNAANRNGLDLYVQKFGDAEPKRLTAGQGTHSISLAPSGDLYSDSFSSPLDPPRAFVRRLSGQEVRKLEARPPTDYSQYSLGKYERLQIPLAEGESLEAAIVYPPDFDAAKKYPVWMLTYAGPHSPTIRDAWSVHLFEQVLANLGIVALRVDPRSASGQGAKSSWLCYKRLGVNELKDLEAAADWLAKKPWCDASRIGISGHSFGGFITAYALTHSKKFAAGIAGAPVTDWRLYDSIYTERYMGLPKENKAGYDESSVVLAAKNLHGRLLILHGLIDDNVHFQNAMQLADALQKANKPFEMMVYPQSRHPIHGKHYQELQIDFIKRTMLPH